MGFEVLPLLHIQQDLLGQPRDLARFQDYLKTMLNAEGDGIAVPINAFNPMSREHIVVILQGLLDLGAEGVLAEAALRVQGEFPALGHYQTGWVLADDVKGSWTHRPTGELRRRRGKDYELSHGFGTVTWWASQGPPKAESLERAASKQLYALAARALEGPKPRLAALWDLEQRARRFAGEGPLPDLPYQFAEAEDDATQVAALYGDAEAKKLGYEALGLQP